MALEDDVHRTFEALAATLRDELSRQLEAIDSDLAAAVREERARVLAAAEQERVQALALVADEHEQALGAARAEAFERARRDVLDQAEKDTNARVAEAEAHARKSGFEDGHAEGYAAGRSEAVDADRAEALELARAQALEIARAEALELDEARSVEAACAAEVALATWMQRACATVDGCRSLSDILTSLAESAAEQSGRASVLVVESGAFRVQAVAGSGGNGPHPGLNSVIAPGEDGAIGLALKNRATVATGGDAVPRVFGPAASDVETLAVPLIVGGMVVAVLYAERRADEREPPRIADATAWAAAIEAAARYAARALEALTASRAAQVAASRPPQTTGEASAAAPPRENEEQSARRYARLLISEIKLYHEPDVIAGRRERDLASRLGGEIMRARALYDQRVSARTRGGADYFNEELIRTLADGDASLLA